MGRRQNRQPPKETLTSHYMRRVDRAQRKLEDDAPHSLFMDIPATTDSSNSDDVTDNVCSTGTHIEMTGDLIDSMTCELQNLRNKNIHLLSDVEHLSSSYDQSAFVATASRVFTDVINVMFSRMKPLVMWPETEQLQKAMPMQFRKHFGKKCAVIIDCFEVFIDRPSNLKARAETWSSYKHHNTVKFLIGITQQDTIFYISNACGGRASGKYITENNGFLDSILPGDLVLADRGFDIQDTLGCVMAQVKIPAFTRGKSQLAPVDIETTRKTVHVRIHVERVIGSVLQKYSILGGTLPIDFLICKDNESVCTIDKIGLVYCALEPLPISS
ncbi:hypothetical protein ABVT39_022029 [Epinephelus coioides]